MGDAADDARDMAEEQYFEYLDGVGRAAKLTDTNLVEQVELYRDDPDEPFALLEEEQTLLATGICQWFHDKGFLTVRQREALISVVATLWTE